MKASTSVHSEKQTTYLQKQKKCIVSVADKDLKRSRAPPPSLSEPPGGRPTPLGGHRLPVNPDPLSSLRGCGNICSIHKQRPAYFTLNLMNKLTLELCKCTFMGVVYPALHDHVQSLLSFFFSILMYEAKEKSLMKISL